MSIVGLISCASKKLPHRAQAQDMYVSPLFRLALKYAQHLSPEKIFILSAKYCLIHLDDEIDPYDRTLNELPAGRRKDWAQHVIEKLSEQCDLHRDHFVVLARNKYRQYLLPYLASYEVPLAGLGIGKQLSFLKEGDYR
jgi:hypothetical protein